MGRAAGAAKGGKAVSKYIDVDVFIKSFREALPGMKAQVDPDLTPKAYAYLRGGEAIIEDLIKFPAADVAPVRHAKWVDNHCTACGMMPMGDEMWKNRDFEPPLFERFMDYCPSCGALMDKEE